MARSKSSKEKHRPIIGITVDSFERPEVLTETQHFYNRGAYARAVMAAGGLPILIPYFEALIPEYLNLCDGIILSGGDDPDVGAFGQVLDPDVTLIDPDRQAFETALIEALYKTKHPVLGICLGMQMMALCAGGKLDQKLSKTRGKKVGERHRNAEHEIQCLGTGHPIFTENFTVRSYHQQSVMDPGHMSVVAMCPEDGVIEAIEGRDTSRFYMGVQWHPEKTEDERGGQVILETFVGAC